MNQLISDYLNSTNRNKIILSRSKDENFEYIDVGKELSKKINKIKNIKKISFKAKDILFDLLNKSIKIHEDYGKVCAISNFGMLLENELKIDFLNLLDTYSKDYCLILHWEGIVEGKYIYFLKKKKGIKFNIEKLSYIKI